MNPEIRARWTAALRSGDYPQGANALRRHDRWCCLGVLCDLAEKAGVTTGRPNGELGSWTYDGWPDLLPPSVGDWAGLDTTSPEVMIENWNGDGRGYDTALTSLNDDERWDFPRIADAIDGGAQIAPEAPR
jgi:hypothetical protein